MDQADPATLDPLAALEAEYAAVVAQTSLLSTEISCIHPGDVESACTNIEDEAITADDEDVGGNDGDNTKHSQSESKSEEMSLKRKDNGRLLENKQVAIMKSMQQVKIRPPPWAQAVNMTDEELVNMVTKQLRLKQQN
ncbi:unnamed protein product [Peronospora destructor]|uniref:Uncharacterized protein n=1 Tax=Peronospora destructor TaxID=86335 RepID=A0AAV0TCK1_9STRA|nr:unnamed protein product [Peronospora destructor]